MQPSSCQAGVTPLSDEHFLFDQHRSHQCESGIERLGVNLRTTPQTERTGDELRRRVNVPGALEL
jgi:hypothetical protein